MRILYVCKTASLICCLIMLFSCKKDDVNYSLNDKPRWQQVPGLTGLRRYEALDLMVDASGNIWAAFGQGVGKYDGKSWNTYRPFNYDLESAKINNYAHGLGQDKNGDIWVTINNEFMTSACRFDGNNWSTHELYGGMVPAINQLKNGQLWFNAGSFIYENGTWSSLDCGIDCPGALCSVKDKNGVLWFGGTDGKITTYDGNSFSEMKIPYTFFQTCDVVDLTVSPTGEIYAALGGGGAWKYNGTSWVSVFIPEITSSTVNVTSVTCVMQDSKGSVWIGTGYDNIYEITNGKTIQHNIPNGQAFLISKIVEGKNGKLYMGAAGGVFDYDYNRK